MIRHDNRPTDPVKHGKLVARESETMSMRLHVMRYDYMRIGDGDAFELFDQVTDGRHPVAVIKTGDVLIVERIVRALNESVLDGER